MSDDYQKNDVDEAEEPVTPEPPVRYDPEKASHEPPSSQNDNESFIALFRNNQSPELVSASRFMLAGAIAGPFSMIFGGVLLSSISLILAIIGYRKAVNASAHANPEMMQMLLRFAKTAIGVCILALIVNAVFLIFFYPTMYESLVTGDLNGLFNSGSASTESTGNSTWG